MEQLDYIIILLYFLGLIAVSVVMSRKIKNSEDMFIAGRNSSWWLSGVSSYMTIFSASTFVVWGGVAYKSGLVAVVVALCLGVASFIVGKWISGKWRELRIKSPGEFLTIRFGHRTVSFYTISGIIARAVHTAVSLYAVAVVMCALIKVDGGSIFASTGMMGDSPMGYLSIWWALLILGAIALGYTIAGGFLAVLMTDVIQFGVLLAVVVFMIPLSFNAVGGVSAFIDKASEIPGFFSGTSPTYTWGWLLLWIFLNVSMIGGDWPFVQRYISVPTTRDAKKSTYLIGILYLVTPLIWYLPTMIYRVMEPGLALDLDATTMTFNGEHAYVNMSKLVLMKGMVGMMLAAMLSATLSNVSGILSLRPGLEWAEIDNSRSFLTTLNPYGNVCPDRSPLDKYILGKENSWYKKYRSYIDEKLDVDAFFTRLFIDVTQVESEYDKYDLIHRFWLMASLMQCLDRQVPIWDIFTEEEILAWAEIENYKYFAQKGPEPVSHGRSWGLASRTLRHLLDESAEDLVRKRHGINLNFGHDGVLMAILTNLQAGTWAREASNSKEALQSWKYWDIPMGANLQMIFYQSEDNPDVLVKFMLNEKDLRLPLEAVEASYYKWNEVYKFYIEHCDKVEKSLAETLKLSYEDF